MAAPLLQMTWPLSPSSLAIGSTVLEGRPVIRTTTPPAACTPASAARLRVTDLARRVEQRAVQIGGDEPQPFGDRHQRASSSTTAEACSRVWVRVRWATQPRRCISSAMTGAKPSSGGA